MVLGDEMDRGKLYQYIDYGPDLSNRVNIEAQKYYGTTDDVHRAGWITPDGKMLDFGRGSKPKIGEDYRTINHENVSLFFQQKFPDLFNKILQICSPLLIFLYLNLVSTG